MRSAHNDNKIIKNIISWVRWTIHSHVFSLVLCCSNFLSKYSKNILNDESFKNYNSDKEHRCFGVVENTVFFP